MAQQLQDVLDLLDVWWQAAHTIIAGYITDWASYRQLHCQKGSVAMLATLHIDCAAACAVALMSHARAWSPLCRSQPSADQLGGAPLT